MMLTPGMSQIREDFSDGNLTQKPIWSGDVGAFEINTNQQLQLNAPKSKRFAFLSTPSPYNQGFEARFWVSYLGNPSSSNHPLVYLTATSNTDIRKCEAYVLKIGGESGRTDKLSLYRQENSGSRTEIISSAEGVVLSESETLDAKIRVRYNAGVFTLFIWKSNRWETLAESTPQPIIEGSYFGLAVNYTSSRVKSFRFDDLFITPLPDLTAPLLKAFRFKKSTLLEMEYTETLEKESATKIENHKVSGHQIDRVFLQDSLITLNISPPIRRGAFVTYTAQNFSDTSGNTIIPIDTTRQFYSPQKGDLIISEIMPNPKPSRGTLPEAEYIEVFNPNDFPIPLQSLSLLLSGKKYPLIKDRISPKSLQLILNKKDTSKFSEFDRIVSEKSFYLNNKSATLELFLQNQKVDSLQYDIAREEPASKRAGGWALEKIPNANCPDATENRRFSQNPNGGSPQKINVFKRKLTWIFGTPNENSISVTFNNTVNTDHLPWMLNGVAQNNAEHDPLKKPSKTMRFPFQNLSKTQEHHLQIPSVTSCVGSAEKNIRFSFGIPSNPKKNNVVINEILYEQTSDVPEYIEIFNTSPFFFETKNFHLRIQNSGSKKIQSLKLENISNHLRQLKPESYTVITSDKNLLYQRFEDHGIDSSKMVQLPLSLANEGGSIALLHLQNASLLDSVYYSEKMHFRLFSSELKKGVALEKIFPKKNAENIENWTSAIQKNNFGSPTYENSASRQEQTKTDPFSLSQKQISPNQNGIYDHVSIHYEDLPPQHLISISIWDNQGFKVKTLLEKERSNRSGASVWKGKSDLDEILPTGIYIVLIETYNSHGVREKTWKDGLYLHYLPSR